MQRLITVVVVFVLAASTVAAAGCGSSTKTISQTGASGEVTTKTVPNIHFAKTKFVLHMGLASGGTRAERARFQRLVDVAVERAERETHVQHELRLREMDVGYRLGGHFAVGSRLGDGLGGAATPCGGKG